MVNSLSRLPARAAQLAAVSAHCTVFGKRLHPQGC